MSTSGYAPPQKVDGPQPSAPRFGLVQNSRILPVSLRPDGQADEHWMNGAMVYPYPANCAEAFNQCGVDAGNRDLPMVINDSKRAGGELPIPVFEAFPVYLPETCIAATVGADAQGWFENRALQTLLAVEGEAVEREFFFGDHLPNNPHILDGNLDILNPLSGGVSPAQGLAMLETAIANTCRSGVIHCSVAMAAYWGGYLLREEKNGQTLELRTLLGTLVIPGQGYTDAIPEDVGGDPTDCLEWAFATGPIEITRSEPFTNPPNYAEALDRTSNVVTFRAERYYRVVWDTILQAGVLIDRDLTGCDSLEVS